MFPPIPFLLVAGLALNVLGADSPVPGYTTEPPTWHIDKHEINGTLEDVNAFLGRSLLVPRDCDPKFTTGVDPDNWSGEWEFASHGTHCDMDDGKWPYGDAYWCSSVTMAKHLLDADKSATISTGRHNCAKLSGYCDSRAAAWLCNENKDKVTIKKRDIGFIIWQLTQTCRRGTEGLKLGGQMFIKQGWNVILRDAGGCKQKSWSG